MINEFWIIDKSGICLFHRSVDKNETSSADSDQMQLISGFLSSILNLYSQISSDELQKILGEGFKFLFFSYANLIFMVRANLNTNDNQIKKKINIIQKSFIKKYATELENFDGNIDSFKKFEKDLDQIFKKISKLEKWSKGLSNL